jgi:uncharacterized membrane protein YgdD (TMEM256/DUF423 family)
MNGQKRHLPVPGIVYTTVAANAASAFMHRTLVIAAVNGLLVVLLGAFGAHALETRIPADLLETWNTSVQYHMFHTLALLGAGLLQRDHAAHAGLKLAVKLFLAGIILFCGSLYVLALTAVSALGMITPIGGVLFLAAWGQLALACHRLPRQ